MTDDDAKVAQKEILENRNEKEVKDKDVVVAAEPELLENKNARRQPVSGKKLIVSVGKPDCGGAEKPQSDRNGSERRSTDEEKDTGREANGGKVMQPDATTGRNKTTIEADGNFDTPDDVLSGDDYDVRRDGSPISSLDEFGRVQQDIPKMAAKVLQDGQNKTGELNKSQEDTPFRIPRKVDTIKKRDKTGVAPAKKPFAAPFQPFPRKTPTLRSIPVQKPLKDSGTDMENRVSSPIKEAEPATVKSPQPKSGEAPPVMVWYEGKQITSEEYSKIREKKEQEKAKAVSDAVRKNAPLVAEKRRKKSLRKMQKDEELAAFNGQKMDSWKERGGPPRAANPQSAILETSMHGLRGTAIGWQQREPIRNRDSHRMPPRVEGVPPQLHYREEKHRAHWENGYSQRRFLPHQPFRQHYENRYDPRGPPSYRALSPQRNRRDRAPTPPRGHYREYYRTPHFRGYSNYRPGTPSHRPHDPPREPQDYRALNHVFRDRTPSPRHNYSLRPPPQRARTPSPRYNRRFRSTPRDYRQRSPAPWPRATSPHQHDARMTVHIREQDSSIRHKRTPSPRHYSHRNKKLDPERSSLGPETARDGKKRKRKRRGTNRDYNEEDDTESDSEFESESESPPRKKRSKRKVRKFDKSKHSDGSDESEYSDDSDSDDSDDSEYERNRKKRKNKKRKKNRKEKKRERKHKKHWSEDSDGTSSEDEGLRRRSAAKLISARTMHRRYRRHKEKRPIGGIEKIIGKSKLDQRKSGKVFVKAFGPKAANLNEKEYRSARKVMADLMRQRGLEVDRLAKETCDEIRMPEWYKGIEPVQDIVNIFADLGNDGFLPFLSKLCEADFKMFTVWQRSLDLLALKFREFGMQHFEAVAISVDELFRNKEVAKGVQLARAARKQLTVVLHLLNTKDMHQYFGKFSIEEAATVAEATESRKDKRIKK